MAATAMLAFPTMETLAISDPNQDEEIVSPVPEKTGKLAPAISIDQNLHSLTPAQISLADCKEPSQNIFEVCSGDSELESSSLDSFQLTESPDATTISTSSHRSSLSSLSGLVRKNGGMSLQWSMSPKYQRGPVSSPMLKPLTSGRKSEYHELRDQLAKYNARQGPAKANYLRLSLLSFLRKQQAYIMPSAFEQEFPLRVLGAWYDQLLIDLSTNPRNVNGSDRNAYYEAISGLMARPEWLDHQHEPLYQSLLQRTMTHTLSKSSVMPHLPVAQAAHLGKVMAYGYLYIPGVAEILLKNLNVRRESIMRFMSLRTNTAANPLMQLVGVPPHLKDLVNATCLTPGIVTPEWLSVVPEKDWVRHWHAESLVFASFLKHLCSLQTQFFPIMNPLGVGFAEGEEADAAEALVLSAPGMILVLSALVDNFDAIVSQSNRALGTRTGNPYARRTLPVATNPMGRVHINQIKCFSAFREILHSDDSTLLYFTSFCRAFDRVVRATAVRCEVYDMDSSVTVCDLAEEWMSSVFLVPSAKSEQHILANHYRILDWGFWLTVAQRMLRSDNCHTEIRALSFLFNIWPNIPGYCRGQNNDMSYLQYATDWILLPETFLQLFCHWSPLVRSYYHRILCYRIASVGIDAESWFLDVESAAYYGESRALLSQRLNSIMLWCADLASVANTAPSTSPSLPVPRMRISIRPNAAQQAATHRIESGLSRLYPFDVFDNAAYWLPEPSYPDFSQLKRQTSVTSKASIQSSATGASIASGVSHCTASSDLSESSFTSNDSERSETSISSQSSRASRTNRLSLTGLVSALPFSGSKRSLSEAMDGENDNRAEQDTKTKPTEPKQPIVSSTSEGISTTLKKRWSFLKGILSSRNSNKDEKCDMIGSAAGTSDSNNSGPVATKDADASTQPVADIQGPELTASNPAGKLPQPMLRTRSRSQVKTIKLSKQEKQLKNLERKRTLRMNRKREQHEAAQAVVPLPPQLAEQRPEIVRVPFRFVLIPGNGPPLSADKGAISVPRLPFSPPLSLSEDPEASTFRTRCTDLAVWNYGFRSLAEWKVTVKTFEGFATQERERANGNIEMLQMPFLVAEIPWRAVG